jgi:hypothetical protein
VLIVDLTTDWIVNNFFKSLYIHIYIYTLIMIIHITRTDPNYRL